MLARGHFYFGNIAQFLDKPVEHLAALGDMGQFATSENDGNGDLVLMLEEFAGMVDFEVDIMIARFGTNPNFLGPTMVSIRSVAVLPFLLLVLELPMVHDPADGRPFGRSHLDQIQSRFFGLGDRLFGWHDAQLFAVVGDDSDRSNADLLVDPLCAFDGGRPPNEPRNITGLPPWETP